MNTHLTRLNRWRYAALATAFIAVASSYGQERLVPIERSPDLHTFSKDATPINPSGPVSVGIGLNGYHKAEADAFVASQYDPTSPNYHQWIDAATFAQRFGASDSDVQAVVSYLTEQGFTNIHVGAGKSYVSAQGTFAVASSAFATSFSHFVRPADLVAKGGAPLFYGPSSPINLPKELVGKVEGVFGLTDLDERHGLYHFGKAKAAAKKKTNQNPLTPQQVASAYDSTGMESSVHGAGLKIAVYSPVERIKTDPTAYATHFGIPKDFTITDQSVDGGANSTNGQLEATVDQETIIGQAYKANITMVETPNNGVGEIDAFDWVYTNKGFSVMSTSWGYGEDYLIHGGFQSQATQFGNVTQQLASEGVSVFVAAGDSAAYDYNGDVGVTMEAASPWVTGVGGTSMFINSSNAWSSEVLWQYSGTHTSASGGSGGYSKLFKTPSWQSGYGVPKSTWREVPDVSAMSASNTPWAIVYKGSANYDAWGTSLAAPLWAVNTLLIDETLGLKLGLIDPSLYVIGNQFESPSLNWTTGFVLHDITSGSDGAYSCTPGFDVASGWGSARFGRLLNDLGYLAGVSKYAPDYEPYTPSSWTHPIMFNTSGGSPSEPSTLEHGVKYYIGVCHANNGTTGTADGYAAPFSVTIDGKSLVNGTLKAVPIGDYFGYFGYTTTTLTAGTHTIKFTVNAGPKYRETNYSNDSYTRTITVH